MMHRCGRAVQTGPDEVLWLATIDALGVRSDLWLRPASSYKSRPLRFCAIRGTKLFDARRSPLGPRITHQMSDKVERHAIHLGLRALNLRNYALTDTGSRNALTAPNLPSSLPTSVNSKYDPTGDSRDRVYPWSVTKPNRNSDSIT